MRKNKQWICIFISLFILLSGMCLENIHTDAMYFCVQKEESTFIQLYAPDFSVEARAEELARGNYTSSIQGATNQTIQIRRSLRVVYELLCKVDVASLSNNFYATGEDFAYKQGGFCAVVTNYIHNTDGKKRI